MTAVQLNVALWSYHANVSQTVNEMTLMLIQLITMQRSENQNAGFESDKRAWKDTG